MNVSPATLLRPECTALLARLPLDRVLLELSEHDQVEDYTALDAVLQPLRRAGCAWPSTTSARASRRCGTSCALHRDVLELDRTIVDGVAGDPVLRTLVGALVQFAHGCSATVVAEGVETAEDAAALLALEVDLGQGWHFGRPAPVAALDAAPPDREPAPPSRSRCTCRSSATARAARTRTPLDLVVGVTGTPTR
jgi:EAL domain-containing protein (putative c-di-GMP-specific phosphodiesterase class I)